MDRKQRFFIDMDGTITFWEPSSSFEEVCEPGYFSSLEPIIPMIDTIKRFLSKNYDVYIASAVLKDNHSAKEKRQWLKKYLPGIDDTHVIFIPCGMSKADYIHQVTGEQREDDILLDDYSNNLHDWRGIGIKAYNGLNGTNGSWNGLGIKTFLSSRHIIDELKDILIA